MEEKELLLREDRRLLGRLLGEVIRSQAGEEALERIERIRQTAVRFRKEDEANEGASRGELELPSGAYATTVLREVLKDDAAAGGALPPLDDRDA